MIITKLSPHTKEELERLKNTKIAIESLSMDLLRVALGYHRGSITMSKRFSDEALKRINEIDLSAIKPYFAEVLKKLPGLLNHPDRDRIAEDSLMYSTICKNYAKKLL